jgi:hypothetical protein
MIYRVAPLVRLVIIFAPMHAWGTRAPEESE